MNGRSAPSLRPAVVIPFAIVSVIWGSTWLVIRDQLDGVPPSWSVTYRFIVAAAAMFLIVAFRRQPLWIGGRALGIAALIGLTQFVANFNLVYRAEQFLTSGIVAVFFALLLIPNSLLAFAMFREPLSRQFLGGSLVAMAGVVLLLLHEYRTATIDPANVLAGVGLCGAALFSVSIANVVQATASARAVPIFSLLAWAMLAGALIDALFAWAVSGPPVIDLAPQYLGGVLYLGLFGSVVTFPLYYRLIRDIGAGPASYSGVAVPVIAMLLSTAFESYRWSALAVTGALMSLAGMVIALRARTRSQ